MRCESSLSPSTWLDLFVLLGYVRTLVLVRVLTSYTSLLSLIVDLMCVFRFQSPFLLLFRFSEIFFFFLPWLVS